MKPRAHYEVAVYKDGTVFVIDRFDERNPTTTVTNDAEAVVEELWSMFKCPRIVYRDTEGHWDEITHTNGKFTGFKPYYGQVPK